MRLSLLYILFVPYLLLGNVNGPSFNCNQKLSALETKVCTNQELSKLDLSLSKLYKTTYSTLTDANKLKLSQRKWMKLRNKCKSDFCILEAYQNRIKEIEQISSTKTPFEPKLIYSTNDKLCKIVLSNYLNTYYEGSALQYKQEDKLLALEWEEQLEHDHKRINSLGKINNLGKINLKFKNNNVSLLRWQELFSWKGDTYSAYLYSSNLNDVNFKDINKSQVDSLRDKGEEIYPNASLAEDFDNTKYGIYSSEWRDIDIFSYQDKYYYENKLNDHWSVFQNNIATLEILEDGTLKPTCVVKHKYDGENLLLKKKYFSKLLDTLSNMTGIYGNCGTMRSGDYILNVRIPTTLEKISFNPWKSSFYSDRDKQLSWMDEFLEEWGYRGLWNYDVYTRYLNIKDKAKQDLVDYYMEVFNLDEYTAQDYADASYDQIISAHFNIPYYGTASKPNDSLREALLKGKSVQEIKPMLTGEWKGPKKDSWQPDTESTLFYALHHPHLVKFLLNEGINVNSDNSFGKTALMYAAQYNLYDTAKLLLESKIDINKQTIRADDSCSYTINRQAVTALHYAVRYADSKFVKLLLDNGANKELKDSLKNTAYDWIELFKEENELLTESEIKKIKSLLKPISEEEYKKIAEKNVKLGLSAYRKKDYENAAIYYEKALQYDGLNITARSDLALVYYQLKKYPQAARAAKSVFNIGNLEKDAAAHYNMGMICTAANDSILYEGKIYCLRAPVLYYIEAHKKKSSKSRAKKVIEMLFENDTIKLKEKYALLETKDKKIKVIYSGVFTYIFSKENLDKYVTIQSKYKNKLKYNHLKQVDKIEYENTTYYVYLGREGNVVELYKSKNVSDKKICYDEEQKVCSELKILFE